MKKMCFIKTYFNNAKSIFISKFNYNFKLCNVQTATITVRTQLEKLHTRWRQYIQKMKYLFYVKLGQTRPLFCLFQFFSHDKYRSNLTINDKSFDGVPETRTRDGKMVGAEYSTELWRTPKDERLLLSRLSFDFSS